MNYCHEICERLEIRGYSEPPRPPIATGLLTVLASHFLPVIVEFPTTRTELNAVFDIFDRHRTGEINYGEFMEALRPERQVGLRGQVDSARLSVKPGFISTGNEWERRFHCRIAAATHRNGVPFVNVLKNAL